MAGRCPKARHRLRCPSIPSRRYEGGTTRTGFTFTRGRRCPVGWASVWTSDGLSTSYIRSPADVGGPEMAPHTPQRSSRPGGPGALLGLAPARLRQRHLADVPRKGGDAHDLLAAVERLLEVGNRHAQLNLLDPVDGAWHAAQDVVARVDAIDAEEVRIGPAVDLRLGLGPGRQRPRVVQRQRHRPTGLGAHLAALGHGSRL